MRRIKKLGWAIAAVVATCLLVACKTISYPIDLAAAASMDGQRICFATAGYVEVTVPTSGAAFNVTYIAESGPSTRTYRPAQGLVVAIPELIAAGSCGRVRVKNTGTVRITGSLSVTYELPSYEPSHAGVLVTTAPPSSGACIATAGSHLFTVNAANGFVTNPSASRATIYEDRSVPVSRVYDARSSSLGFGLHNQSATDPQLYAIKLWNSDDVCWSGGRLRSSNPDNLSWGLWHDINGYRVGGIPNFIFEDTFIYNFGDSINLSDGDRGQVADNFVIRDTLIRHSHDDCIQNDKLAGGLLDDSLLDGCYVGLSARMSDADETGSSLTGRGKTWRIENTLIRMEPMPTVYSGSAPGHGGFFKWEHDANRALRVALHNVILRADQLPNHQSLGLDDGMIASECTNVTIVWLGSGSFPGNNFPAGCVTITRDVGVWDRAVADWHARHPSFADVR